MDKFAFDWFQKQLDKRKEPKKYLLWIDDIRPVPNNYISNYHIIVAKNYKEVSQYDTELRKALSELGESD